MIRLLKNLKPYAALVAGILILVLLQTLSELYIPSLMANIVDNGIIKNDVELVKRVGIYMILFTLASILFNIMSSYLSALVSAKFSMDLRSRIFTKVESFSLDEFNQFGTASLVTRTTNDVSQMQMIVLVMLRMMVMAPIMSIGGTIMAIMTDVGLSWVLIVAIFAIVFAISIVIKTSGKLFSSLQLKLDKINLIFRENITGIRVIRAFDRIDYEQKRFGDSNLDLTDTAIKANKIMAVLMPTIMVVLNFTTVFIVWFGSKRINLGAMNIGSLMAYIQYTSQILFSFVMMSMLFVMIPRATASAKRINEVLDTNPSIKDKETFKYSDSITGEIEFKNVSFAYCGACEPVLKNISFKASKGEITAIVGGTGSGKTTLINLIPRFYEATNGEILIDNVNIIDMPQQYLRDKISIVPQKAVLFSGTIKDNIKYGNLDATDEDITKATDIAQAIEFINKMESGFDSVIAQGGKNISGGQKQRISIARALVKKPEIYIFDDSFSALDAKTDAKLRSALKDVIKNSTVIIVAQKISSILNADQIIVLDDGQISGIGTHKELMLSNEIYKQMATSQLREESIS